MAAVALRNDLRSTRTRLGDDMGMIPRHYRTSRSPRRVSALRLTAARNEGFFWNLRPSGEVMPELRLLDRPLRGGQ